MAKLYVSYRGEFGAEVEVEEGTSIAEKVAEAIGKFEDEHDRIKIEIVGELHPSFFEVTDVATEQVLQEEG